MLYSCSIMPANIENGNGINFYLDSLTTLTTTANIRCIGTHDAKDYSTKRSAKVILIGL